MSNNWEATFSSWGAPPSATEQARCASAERAVRKAIEASETLNSKSIRAFAQGSYANRTNVRQDSDVDVCVLCTETFFSDFSLSQGLNGAILGHEDATYHYSEFKADVETALISYFGDDSVVRGQKAFDIHANTYRIDADVVPCFEHKRFLGTPENHWEESGTEIRPDDGGRIINWPRQNYDNGVSKNEVTGRCFKAVTRILKRLRNQMFEEGYDAADPKNPIT